MTTWLLTLWLATGEALAAANLERAELLAALEGVLPFLTGDYSRSGQAWRRR